MFDSSERALSEAAILKNLPSAGVLPAHVKLAMARSDGHAAYHVAAGLIALTQTVPLEYHAVMGRKVYPTLFALNVGPSTGSRKSTAVDFAEELVRNAVIKHIGSWPDSKQGLIKSLGHIPQQVLFYQEFGATLATLQQNYAQPLKTTICAAYDCTPLSLAQSREGTTASQPRLSMFGGVAPAFFEEHTTLGDWDGGFLARFMLFYGMRERHLSSSEASREPNSAQYDSIKAMMAIRCKDAEKNTVKCLGFTPGCDALWRDWEKWIDSGEVNSLIKASIGRANDFIMKIALLLAWDSGRARRGINFKLNEEELTCAMSIARFHVHSAIKLQSSLAISRDMRDRRRVLSSITSYKEKAVPISHVIHESQLLAQRVEQIIRSLKDERMIKATFKPDKFSGDTLEHFYRIPYQSPVGVLQEEKANVIDMFSRKKVLDQCAEGDSDADSSDFSGDSNSGSSFEDPADDAAVFDELL